MKRARLGKPSRPRRGVAHHARAVQPGGLAVRCYACHGVGAVDADGPFDAVADRDAWPECACFFTPGCPGAAVPEALN